VLPKRCAHIGSRELRLIFENLGLRTIEVGQLQQDTTIPARLDIDEMLNKHFAVLGTTGVGKSSAAFGHRPAPRAGEGSNAGMGGVA
jgi:putative ribosome biogenesis GTPase RsgA